MKSFLDLVEIAANKGASDIELVPGKSPTMKRDGKFMPIPGDNMPPLISKLDAENYIRETIEYLLRVKRSPITVDKFLDRVRQEGQQEVVWALEDRRDGLRLRISVHRSSGHIEMSMRLLTNRIWTFEEIFLVDQYVEQMKSWLGRKHGILFLTGPTGVGKTTTAITFLDHMLRSGTGHLITFENPIEHEFSNQDPAYPGWIISQKEWGLEPGEGDFSDWPTAIRASLRQTPTSIWVSEIRDQATAKAALQIAESGHFVLATMHNSTVHDAVTRFINFFPIEAHLEVRTQFTLQTIGIIGQKLIHRSDGRGLVACVEIASMSTAYAQLIYEGKFKQLANQIRMAGQNENISFDQYTLELALKGVLTPADARRLVENPKEFDDSWKALHS